MGQHRGTKNRLKRVKLGKSVLEKGLNADGGVVNASRGNCGGQYLLESFVNRNGPTKDWELFYCAGAEEGAEGKKGVTGS